MYTEISYVVFLYTPHHCSSVSVIRGVGYGVCIRQTGGRGRNGIAGNETGGSNGGETDVFFYALGTVGSFLWAFVTIRALAYKFIIILYTAQYLAEEGLCSLVPASRDHNLRWMHGLYIACDET